MYKDNYNIFSIHSDSIMDVLKAYPNTCDSVDSSLLQLIKSNVNSVHPYKRLTLDSFIYIKLVKVDDYGSDSGFLSEYIISMDDGLPKMYAEKVFDRLLELGIKFKLNGLTKGQIVSNTMKRINNRYKIEENK